MAGVHETRSILALADRAEALDLDSVWNGDSRGSRGHGHPFDKRVGRLMEGFRLCRAMWTGEPVDWEGRWTKQGVLVPKPFRSSGPTVCGGNGAAGIIEC